jgi:hypothetical protein
MAQTSNAKPSDLVVLETVQMAIIFQPLGKNHPYFLFLDPLSVMPRGRSAGEQMRCSLACKLQVQFGMQPNALDFGYFFFRFC